jgi:hypothetical protein
MELLGITSPPANLTPTQSQTVLGAFAPYLTSLGSSFLSAQPALTPLIEQVVSLDGDLVNILLSLTGFVPDQLLAAETQLAEAIGPVAQALPANPVTPCLATLVGVLTSLAG